MSKVIQLRDKARSIARINKAAEAMQIVAVAQLKGIQSRQRAAFHFKKHYSRLAKRLGLDRLPRPKSVQPVVLVYALASQRGFCGSFNENLISRLCGFLTKQKEAGKETRLVVIGKKGCELCQEKKLPDVFKQFPDLDKAGFEQATRDITASCQLYFNGQIEEVYMFYNEFHSMLEQRTRLSRLLPFDLAEIYVPAENIIFDLPLEPIKNYVASQYARVLFYDAFMQTRLGEVGSRLMTMRNATESSKEMLNSLSIKLNKARQAMITVELSEILSSFEMLAGEEG